MHHVPPLSAKRIIATSEGWTPVTRELETSAWIDIRPSTHEVLRADGEIDRIHLRSNHMGRMVWARVFEGLYWNTQRPVAVRWNPKQEWNGGYSS